MFRCKNWLKYENLCRRTQNTNIFDKLFQLTKGYSGLTSIVQNKYVVSAHKTILHRKWCSSDLFHDQVNGLEVKHDRAIKKITDLFPEARVALNILATRTPNKVFDVTYKQNNIAHKENKKEIPNGDWTCTYTFTWPEKMKFEQTAISKRQAAEKAATQAVHWLYVKRKIDSKGYPILEKNEEENKGGNEPICMSVSDNSYEKAEKVWDYQQGRTIKKITDLFPEPRVALNILATRTPDKIFDVIYKQNNIAHKEKKKGVQNGDWTCTYTFTWPEKIKFEKTGISKRQAAEKAATQAVHWLYVKRKIDSQGYPIFEKNVEGQKNMLNEPKHMTTSGNEPICMSISDKCYDKAEIIWNNYQQAIKHIYDETFKNSKHTVITAPPAVVTKDSTIDEEDFLDKEEEYISDEFVTKFSESNQHVHPVYGSIMVPPNAAAYEKRDAKLKKKFEFYDEALTPLPTDNFSEQIASELEKSQVLVLVGAPGCGKSTRAPTAILRHWGAKTAAVVTQPRRVAAIGLAERVASELHEEVGETIGYQVRLLTKQPKPPCGSILYCTSGILLRRLQTNPGLEGCSHVIIDEAHERDVNTDVTLLLLKRALVLNPQLKILIMSATIDSQIFTKYFGDCPVIEVPGRTYPVEISHLEDIEQKFGIRLPNTTDNCLKGDGRPLVNCEEVAAVIKAVDKSEEDGAILVFLPGWSEIKQTKQILDAQYGSSGTHLILPVHSRLSTEDQTKMFSVPAPGVRKIVLATNVAETSITIPDVVYVIDSGSHKETGINEITGVASLEAVWVSKASSKQRAGRAGRVRPGHCYRMYTKEKEDEFAPYTRPEILRIPLEQTLLNCKSYAPNESLEDFLSQLLEPPSKKSVQLALKDLVEMGALTHQEQLTRLGSKLSTLTVHPRIGKTLLHSAVIGNIVALSNVAAQYSGNTEIFVNSVDRRSEIREIKSKYSADSDHVALHKIQDEFVMLKQDGGRSASDAFCEKYLLRGDRLAFMNSISNMQLELVLKCGIQSFTEADELNRFSDIDQLTCSVFMSGTDSLLVTNRQIKTKGKAGPVAQMLTSTGDRAQISSQSVNYKINKCSTKNNLLAYFGGFHSRDRRALVVHKSSLVSPQAVLLFCPGDIREYIDNSDDSKTILELPKHRLKLHVPTAQAAMLIRIREMLWNTLQYYIERDLDAIDYDDVIEVSRFKVRLVKLLKSILVEGHKGHCENITTTTDIEELA